ncbi:MAG: hypothetical protein MI922_07465 [Bacteroidales bacterium]|nr:hypothetical protein [Bacteroidales bacterium]
MVLNYIWIGFFIVAFLVALLRVIGYYLHHHWGWLQTMTFDIADRDVFTELGLATFKMAEASIEIIIGLIGVMTLWMGIMKIGEKGGAVRLLSRVTSPLFTRLFPEIPKDHPAMGAMLMNICANMLGLDNAATPLGLKAMKDLQTLNPKKDTASNAQILFLVLNTSGLTLIPITIMAYRMSKGSANPAEIFLPLLMATYFASLGGLIIVSIVQRIKLFQPAILAYVGGITVFIGGLMYLVKTTPQETVSVATTFIGYFLLLLIIIGFLWLGFRKKINVYESFIDGAKEGFGTTIKIIPYLVAMLVAIGVFRASGALDMITDGIRFIFSALGVNTDFVDALPTALMRPLSGSGSRALMLELFTNSEFGPDSFAGRLASIFQGTTETTFYTVAVYYGVVNIKKTRYTIGCGLFADLIGIIAAIFIAYAFFGEA